MKAIFWTMARWPLPFKRWKWMAAAGAVLFSALAMPGALYALAPPPLKGRVNDYAAMLSASTARALSISLQELEQSDSTQIVVLTIPSLDGEPLEGFSLRVAEQWRIGQKGHDNGALLLIAKKERKVRIEVGYGLEGTLTDIAAGRIIRNVIVPRFRAGDFDRGVLDGVQAMVAAVRGEYSAADKRTADGREKMNWNAVTFALFIFLALINLLGRLRRPLGAAAGGVFFPIAAAVLANLNWIWILGMIPIGVAAGFILSFFGAPLSFSNYGTSHSRRGRNWYIGSSGGGSSFGGFGGFSGGGGGFGGGGASGGW